MTVCSDESAEDLSELNWHVAHLRERLEAGRGHPGFRDLCEAAEARLAHLERRLAAPQWGRGGRLARCEQRLRGLYKMIALIETGTEWHSPKASLTRPIHDLSPLSVLAGFNDYQRGYLEWGREIEGHLASEMLPRAGARRQALLFSSGMGAIHTTLQYLLGQGLRILVGRRVYYETQELLGQWLRHCRDQIAPLDEAVRDGGALAEGVRRADAVFLDTVTLDRDGLRVDQGQLYQAVRAAGKPKFWVVLDNTAGGPDFPLAEPPAGVCTVVVESLLKHYQAGLDLAAAGVLIVIGDAARGQLLSKLESMRGTNGTNISPYHARVLPRLPHWLILQRLRRQNRNARLLAQNLSGVADTGPVGCGGLLFACHPEPERACLLLELLSLRRRQPLVKGTSFGFNVTRYALPPTGALCVRFACGMEHVGTMSATAELVRLAFEAAHDQHVAALCEDAAAFLHRRPKSARLSTSDRWSLNRSLETLDRAACLAARTRLDRAS